jgi:hypothetical protein
MLRKRPIDDYIYRATLGLPKHNRVDTSAELRVHLNSRVKELMAGGFPKDESEHLAVQEMGPVEPVNLAFLGHGFTNKLGWIVLAMAIFGGAFYFFSQKHENPLREAMLDGKDFATILANNKLERPTYRKFEVDIPMNVNQVEWALIGWDTFKILDISREKPPILNFLGTKVSMLVGLGAPKVNTQTECKEGSAVQMVLSSTTPEGSTTNVSPEIICLHPGLRPRNPNIKSQIKKATYNEFASSIIGNFDKMNLNEWIPVVNWEINNWQKNYSGNFIKDISYLNDPTKHLAVVVRLGNKIESKIGTEFYRETFRVDAKGKPITTIYNFGTGIDYSFGKNASDMWTVLETQTGK